jgi:hypothetical protein
MYLCRSVLFSVSFILLTHTPKFASGILKRCFVCRSRGELGSCKDPFTVNVTHIELEKGVEAIPCASGWCGKMLETENPLKEGESRKCVSSG